MANGSASPAAAAATSFRWNSARSGFGHLHVGEPLGDPLLALGGQPVHPAIRLVLGAAGRSEVTSPAFSRRVRVT